MKVFLVFALLVVTCFSFSCTDKSSNSNTTASAINLPKSDITQIVLLGTGTPNADPERSGPSVAIVVNGTPYLVDFGPGVVRRAAAAEKAGVKGLAVKNLKRAFVTHLHSDHTAGFPDLILTPWVLERNEPLEVYGPSGIASMTDHILKAYQEDIDIRLNGGEPSNKEGYKVNAHEITSGIVYTDANVTVTAFEVHHGRWRDGTVGHRSLYQRQANFADQLRVSAIQSEVPRKPLRQTGRRQGD